MEIKVSSLILTTASAFDISNFVTQVLDLQVHADESLPYFWLGDLKVCLLEGAVGDQNSILTLFIPENDFEEMVNKFTFFMFRRNADAKDYYQIHHDGIELKDPDGRIWKFKTNSFAEITDHI